MAAAAEAHAISRNSRKIKIKKKNKAPNCSKPIREMPEQQGHRYRKIAKEEEEEEEQQHDPACTVVCLLAQNNATFCAT